MADIHVVVTENGFRLWRVEKTGKGRRFRVPHSDVHVAKLSDISLSATLFDGAEKRARKLEASNDRD